MASNSQRNLNSNNLAINPLNIVYWNSAGLTNKLLELENFMIQQKVDIMMVIEIRCNTASSIHIDGYYCYQAVNPESSRKGGVAIYVKQTIRHSALETIALPSVQCAPIAIYTSNNSLIPMTITPIYCPPIFQWSKTHFNRLFLKLGSLSHGSQLLICGDWNAKHSWWGNVRCCKRGRELLEAIHERDQLNILATGGATHFPYSRRSRPSAIDFAVYSGFQNEALHTYTTVDLDSDHLPVHILLDTVNIAHTSTNTQLLPRNANIQTFQRYLTHSTLSERSINSCTDIEDAISTLNRNIYAAAAASTPSSSSRRISQGPSRIQLSETSQRLLLLKRQYKREHLINHSAASHQSYRRTQNQLKKSLKKDKANQLNILLEQVDTQDRYRLQKLWQITNKVKRQPEPNFPLKIQVDANCPPHWTKTCLEKAESFADHLEQRFSPNYLNQNSDRTTVANELEQNKQRLLNTTAQDFRLITASEIAQIIDTLPSRKSPGWDSINNKILKSLPNPTLDDLALIYNSMLRLSHFPEQWKLATISMVLKPGKCANEVTSYRPISLLCSFSKLFEKLLMDRLFEIEDFEHAIPNHQFGFRKEHGTDQQLFRVTQFILKAFDTQQYCSAVYVDITEAFDRVWHEGLLVKLSKLLPIKLFSILESYLNDRSFLVKGPNGIKSRTCPIRAGVPQGSVLGPILYTIYTSDMPVPNIVQNCNILLSTFADDTVILAASETFQYATRTNQRYLLQLEKWARIWCIKINSSKTAHVVYSTRRLTESQREANLQLNGLNIPNSSRHKYLGLYLDSKLNLKFHIVQLRTRVIALVEKYKWLLGRRSKLTKKCKALIYKQLIAPVWHYAIPIWGALSSNTQFKRIDMLQNKILRKTTNTVWYTRNTIMREVYNISSADDIFKSSSSRLTNTLATHPNYEARQLIVSPYVPERLQRARYSSQLQASIVPLQALIPRPQPQPHIPTLIRLAQEEAARNTAPSSRAYPPPPLSVNTTNSLRRSYNEGRITRGQLAELLQGQHYNVQRLVIPDFLVIEQRGPPELSINNLSLSSHQPSQTRLTSTSLEHRRSRLSELVLQLINRPSPND